MPQNNKRQNESGNVFLFILLGVVLFAALSFTIARGFRSNTTSSMSDRQATLTAQEILNYGQTIERAVNKLRQKGCSEKQISFYHEDLDINNYHKNLYDNSSAPTDKSCHIFYPEGANVRLPGKLPSYEKITTNPTSINASTYHYVMRGQVVGLGKRNSNDPSLRVFDINKSLCEAFNKITLKDSTIYKARMGHLNDLYRDGNWGGDNINDSYAKPGNTNAELTGQIAACIESPETEGSYSIYYVFLVR